MSKVYLQMMYHPAKKEVEFRRFQNGKEVLIEGGKLKVYMNKKGEFVLQDHGNDFFRDIARAFDSIETLEMQVITTKIDYEDLIQMIEYYNSDTETRCRINPTLIKEIPDMKETFKAVVKYGEHAVSILEKYRQELFDIPCITKELIKKNAENFAEEIGVKEKNICDKIESMRDNNVSLCFTGVYSAGKSALINSLLGYRILPEKIKSETAKMFVIRSPKEKERIEIAFAIDNEKTVLTWIEDQDFFEITEGPYENAEKACIQEKINKLKGEPRHVQIAELLKKLNSMDTVSQDIKIKFPISLDSETVQFTIYDTPGTDSNYMKHQEVLSDALSQQTHSILIFVAAPNKLEGNGNNALLKYLKDAENKDIKNSIDLGRSLFVINWSDSIDAEQRRELQSEVIKYKDEDGKIDFSIRLSDKKLFFTSAKMAYAAKAKQNGIATDREANSFKKGLNNMQDKYEGFCYRENRCANSELATSQMQKRCEEALEKAKAEGDDVKILEVCSGIYALEREIIQYGEKYASAVKAFAIIKSVNQALNKLNDSANSLKDSGNEEIEKIQQNIDKLRETIQNEIDKEYYKILPEDGRLPNAILERLNLDGKAVHSLCSIVETDMDKTLKGWFFGLGEVAFDKKKHEEVREICNRRIQRYTDDFLKNRQRILTEQRDDFIAGVKDIIMQNGDISDTAKKYLVDIPVPKIDSVQKVKDLSDIYNARKYTWGKWIFKSEYLDKKGFIEDVKHIFLKVMENMRDIYVKDCQNALGTVLEKIKDNFIGKLDMYSLAMKGFQEDKEAMMKLRSCVEATAVKLRDCEDELNEIIWREIQK